MPKCGFCNREIDIDSPSRVELTTPNAFKFASTLEGIAKVEANQTTNFCCMNCCTLFITKLVSTMGNDGLMNPHVSAVAEILYLMLYLEQNPAKKAARQEKIKQYIKDLGI